MILNQVERKVGIFCVKMDLAGNDYLARKFAKQVSFPSENLDGQNLRALFFFSPAYRLCPTQFSYSNR